MSHNEAFCESLSGGVVVALKQLTLRGFDPDLERRLRLEARNGGLSLNKAAMRLIRRGAGLEEASSPSVVGSSLDHLSGTWSEADEREVLEAAAVFERIDEEFWR